MQSVPITANVVSFEFRSGEVYLIQHYAESGVKHHNPNP